MKWDAVGSILKQTKRKHQLTIKTCTKYVDKKSRYETKSPAKNLQIPNCTIATLSHVCNYKVQFCAFKGDTQNLPLEELVGGDLPPSSSQRLTCMGFQWQAYFLSKFHRLEYIKSSDIHVYGIVKQIIFKIQTLYLTH